MSKIVIGTLVIPRSIASHNYDDVRIVIEDLGAEVRVNTLGGHKLYDGITYFKATCLVISKRRCKELLEHAHEEHIRQGRIVKTLEHELGASSNESR